MNKLLLHTTLLASALALGAGIAAAADQQQTQQQIRAKEQEQIYGYKLMTPQERTEHQNRMRAATTNEEREKIRAEHHDKMQARAKEKGVTLPDKPPAHGGKGGGGGMGPGPGGGPR